ILATFLLVAFLSISGAFSQELNCEVSIVPNNKVVISTVEIEILKQLENTIYEFMNNTKWTKDNFKVEERINCQVQFQLNSIPSPGVYEGMLQVQSSRPCLNSSYNTTVMNFQDDNVSFSYSRNAILAYAPNQYRDNITSILSFYAYY